MRRAWLSVLLAAVVAAAVPAAAADGDGDAGSGPSLEYRPPRPVLPEPKAPMPAPPITVFRESFGGFGISQGAFDGPVDVAVDKDGSVYVLDAGNSRVQMFDSGSNFVAQWGSFGSKAGEFMRPRSIALDDQGRVYVVDTGNNRIQVFSWVSGSCTGECPSRRDGMRLSLAATFGSFGSRLGEFKDPLDLAFEGGGAALWVLDAGNERVQRFALDAAKFAPAVTQAFGRREGSRGGTFTDLVSIGWSDERFGYVYLLGPNCVVQQFRPDGLLEGTWSAVVPETAVCVPARIRSDNRERFLYVLDSGNSQIARFHREGRYQAAIRGADRPFSRPQGFSRREGTDEFVVADTGNNLVQKFTLR